MSLLFVGVFIVCEEFVEIEGAFLEFPFSGGAEFGVCEVPGGGDFDAVEPTAGVADGGGELVEVIFGCCVFEGAGGRD